MRGDDLIKSAVAVQMQVVGAAQQMHGEDQAHQSKVVIAVQMCDEDMVYAMHVRLIAHQLHLRAFATIDEKITVLNLDQLRRGESSVGWKSTA